ncbi:hypothetical protein BGW38_005975 [Lunasporangiospora selenospora]|uniref:Uncharacterized protein n=1 Tax=Lunasporangiospora selenospora TaxID=979761 RepID=A0A9P6KB07_9FUNG|nr:hypothetical protein BGW38_005975 [Lunasporangiospora selenospora]
MATAKPGAFRPFKDPVMTAGMSMETESAVEFSDGVGEESQRPVTPSKPEDKFVLVERRQLRLKAFIPIAVFGPEGTSMVTRRARLDTAYKGVVAPISTPTIQRIRLPNEETERCFVVEVGHHSQLEALLRCGMQGQDENEKIYFQELTEGQQRGDQERTVEIVSLSILTKAAEVQATLSRWGEIENVVMGFNAKKSMATATVKFEDAQAVQRMNSEQVTCVIIGNDSGVIYRLGVKPIVADKSLTMKLASLPLGYTPREVASLLGDGNFFSIVMPLHPRLRKRQMDAYITFQSTAQKDTQTIKRWTIGSKSTQWVSPETPTCFGCGGPGHKVGKECAEHMKRTNMRQARRENVQMVSPMMQRQGQTQTKKDETGKQGPRPLNGTGNRSYSQAVGGMQRSPRVIAPATVKAAPPAAMSDETANLTAALRAAEERAESAIRMCHALTNKIGYFESLIIALENKLDAYFIKLLPEWAPSSLPFGPQSQDSQRPPLQATRGEKRKLEEDRNKQLAQERLRKEGEFRRSGTYNGESSSRRSDSVVTQTPEANRAYTQSNPATPNYMKEFTVDPALLSGSFTSSYSSYGTGTPTQSEYVPTATQPSFGSSIPQEQLEEAMEDDEDF